jgi:hypothetical protein
LKTKTTKAKTLKNTKIENKLDLFSKAVLIWMFAEQLNTPYFKCTVMREEVLIWGSICGNDEVIEAQIQRDQLRTIVQTRGNRFSKHSSS